MRIRIPATDITIARPWQSNYLPYYVYGVLSHKIIIYIFTAMKTENLL
jgi:hypothetical protein